MAMPPEPIYRSIGRRTADQRSDPEGRGERIIDWIAFWSAFGIVGAFVNNFLANRLDECSQWLEDFLVTRAKPAGPYSAEHDHIRARQRAKGTPLPALPPTGGSGIKPPPPACDDGQPRIADKGMISCAGAVLQGGYVRDQLETAIERVNNGDMTILELSEFTHRSRKRWYCGRCNRYFSDNKLAHSHACVSR